MPCLESSSGTVLRYREDHNPAGDALATVTTPIEVTILNYYEVVGKVTLPNGTPLHSLAVNAYDCVLGLSNLLDETITDEHGKYHIKFWNLELAEEAGRSNPNLLVKVFDPSGDEIGKSEVITNPKGLETIDFEIDRAIYGGPREFDRIYAKIEGSLPQILVFFMRFKRIKNQ
ncbi:MAG: hypothetical protein GY816_01115 [Cytophagales bacterium]|nr:hypothetical protein [Cytophagales bacterium]